MVSTISGLLSQANQMKNWILGNLNFNPNRVGILHSWNDVRDADDRSWIVELLHQGDGRIYCTALSNANEADIPMVVGPLPIFSDPQFSAAEKVESIRRCFIPSVRMREVWFHPIRNPAILHQVARGIRLSQIDHKWTDIYDEQGGQWNIALYHTPCGHFSVAAERVLDGDFIPLTSLSDLLIPETLSINEIIDLIKTSYYPTVDLEERAIFFTPKVSIKQKKRNAHGIVHHWRLSFQFTSTRIWIKADKQDDQSNAFHRSIDPREISFSNARARVNERRSCLLVTKDGNTSTYLPFIDANNQLIVAERIHKMSSRESMDLQAEVFWNDNNFFLTNYHFSSRSYEILTDDTENIQFSGNPSIENKVEIIQNCSHIESENGQWQLIPMTQPSWLDPEQLVSYDAWVVTFVDAGASDPKIAKSMQKLNNFIGKKDTRGEAFYGHGQLILEGIKSPLEEEIDLENDQATPAPREKRKNGERVIIRIHASDVEGFLMPSIEDITDDDPPIKYYRGKSPTIRISRQQMYQLVNKARQMQKNPKKFEIRGYSLQSSDPHEAGNCTTFAVLDMLEFIGISLPQTQLEERQPWSVFHGAVGLGAAATDPARRFFGPVTPDRYASQENLSGVDTLLTRVLKIPFCGMGVAGLVVEAAVKTIK